jgi:molybdate transport system substrate-binding protein
VLGYLALFLAILPGPAPRAARSAPRPALTVFAAASLTDAFRDLGRAYEAAHPGASVRFSFAGSQQLAVQIEQGAPADVFASADRRWMEYARDKGVIDGDAPVFARNRLVVIVPRRNPARIRRLEDLARRGTKLVVAAGAVPAGSYTREMLAKLAATPGFPAGFDRQVLANVVSEEENVRSVVSKVQLGEADAGVVYRSDVTPPVARYVAELAIPDSANVIAEYPIARVKASANAAAAREFIALVTSDEGRRILERHGLLGR